jgi:pyrroloquinoline quinone biosynthesis protein D
MRLCPGVVLRHDATRDHWHLLGPERILVLDEIALEIVRACVDTGATVAAGIDDLAARFDAPRAEIAADVLALLDDLHNRGFVAP